LAGVVGGSLGAEQAESVLLPIVRNPPNQQLAIQ